MRRYGWPRRRLALGAGFFVATVLIAGCGRTTDGARQKNPLSADARKCGPSNGLLSIGEKLPDGCILEDFVGGRRVTLGEIRAGKPVMINFWATWCPYCIKEMPDLQRVYSALGDRVQIVGLDLLAINGETRGAAAGLARETGVRYPLAYDEGAILYGHMTARLVMPTTVFARADGTIVYRVFGPQNERRFRELLRTYLRIGSGG